MYLAQADMLNQNYHIFIGQLAGEQWDRDYKLEHEVD